MKKLKCISLHLTETFLFGLNQLVKDKVYPNRAEAIRIAIRDLLKTELTIKQLQELKFKSDQVENI